jgi:hypothetical protein
VASLLGTGVRAVKLADYGLSSLARISGALAINRSVVRLDLQVRARARVRALGRARHVSCIA